MGDITRTTQFQIHFRQRATKRIRLTFAKRLKLFRKNPHDPLLNTHALKHSWEGYSSFSLTDDRGADDFRVVFKKVRGGYLFFDFGTHDQLYRPWQRKSGGSE